MDVTHNAKTVGIWGWKKWKRQNPYIFVISFMEDPQGDAGISRFVLFFPQLE